MPIYLFFLSFLKRFFFHPRILQGRWLHRVRRVGILPGILPGIPGIPSVPSLAGPAPIRGDDVRVPHWFVFSSIRSVRFNRCPNCTGFYRVVHRASRNTGKLGKTRYTTGCTITKKKTVDNNKRKRRKEKKKRASRKTKENLHTRRCIPMAPIQLAPKSGLICISFSALPDEVLASSTTTTTTTTTKPFVYFRDVCK